MGERKKKLSGLILTSSALAGVASTAATTTSAGVIDFLKSGALRGLNIVKNSAINLKKFATEKLLALASLTFLGNLIRKESNVDDGKGQALAIVKADNNANSNVNDNDRKGQVVVSVEEEIKQVLNLDPEDYQGPYEDYEINSMRETFKNFSEALKFIRDNKVNSKFTLEYKVKADSNDKLTSSNLLQRIIQKVNETTALEKGFWSLYESSDSNNLCLEFFSPNDIVNKVRNILDSDNLDDLIKKFEVIDRTLTNGTQYFSPNLSNFYDCLKPVSFNQRSLDPRNNAKEPIKKIIEQLTKKDNENLTNENKEYLHMLGLSLDLYETELKNYVEDVIKKKYIKSTIIDTINSSKFHFHVLNKFVTQLKNDEISEQERSVYLFLAKLIANGIVQGSLSAMLDKKDEKKEKLTKYIKEILKIKKEILNISKRQVNK